MQNSGEGRTDLMSHDVCFHKISAHLQCLFFFCFVYCNCFRSTRWGLFCLI